MSPVGGNRRRRDGARAISNRTDRRACAGREPLRIVRRSYRPSAAPTATSHGHTGAGRTGRLVADRRLSLVSQLLEGDPRVPHVAKTVLRVALEATAQNARTAGRRRRRQARSVDLGAQHRGERVGHGLALERLAPGEHLVQHRAERQDVAPACPRPCPAPAPATCTPPCPIDHAAWVALQPCSVGECVASGTERVARQRLRQAEVEHLDRPSGVSLTLAGFRSRCTMPCSCASSSASAISVAHRAAPASTGSGPPRAARPASRPRPAPCTRHSTSPVSSDVVERAMCGCESGASVFASRSKRASALGRSRDGAPAGP